MNREQARALVAQTFTHGFDKARFRNFTFNLLNHVDESKGQQWNTTYVKDAFKAHVNRYERLGTYASPDKEKLDVLIVYLTSDSKLERARTAIRNFVADHLKTRDEKDAALVAFVSPSDATWRFSYVKMDYAAAKDDAGKVGVETRLTPARRFSYIVGEGESCHTAQTRFLDLLSDTEKDPSLGRIEDAFSVEAVTKEFFTKYTQLFGDINAALEKLLSKDKTLNAEFTRKKVNTVDFSKKLMGQIVFLYFLQKKGWLGVAKGNDWGTGPHDFLRRLARGDYGGYENFFNDILEPLFYDTLATDRGHEAWCSRFKCRIPFLNGGLFEPLGDYDWRRIDVQIPNDLLTNTKRFEGDTVGTGVLDIFDRYNFTVNEAEPLEKEVAIDPEMLGKVFENLIEENRRKGLGAYYTPREIVHYMCQQSLINYLDAALNVGQEKLPRQDIETFVHVGDQASLYEAARLGGSKSYALHLPKTIEKRARAIDETLAHILVCDPAVGSGAFPVGMMTEIVRLRSALTPYFNDVDERTPYHFKRHAIQQCLYGVDIDPGAIEIAKLRLWLSLVVDEEDVVQVKPLPNLDYKVVSGNSLLHVEKTLFNESLFHSLEDLKPRYFDESDSSKKDALKKRIEHLINQLTEGRKQFDFNVYFSEVFHKKSGFDIVIGNPPYGIVFDEKYKRQLQDLFKSFSLNSDIYTAFIERGVKLLHEKGAFAFITPNTYLNGDYFKALRQFLSRETRILEITDYKHVSVFDDQTVFVAVLLCSHSQPAFPYSVHLRVAQTSITDFAQQQFTLSVANDGPFKPADALLARLQRDPRWAPIDELFLVKDVGFNYWTIGRGKKRGENSIGDRVLYSGARKDKRDIPFLKGRDILPWTVSEPDNYLRHDYESFLDPRKDVFRFSPEYLSIRPKVIYRQTSNTIIAAIDCDGRYLDKTVHLIVPRTGWTPQFSDKLLVGLLNSRLFRYLYTYISQETEGRAFAQVKTTYIKKLPVPRNGSSSSKKIVDIVDRILNGSKRDTLPQLEELLNRAVYELYNLSPKEIEAVEKKSSHENTTSRATA
jgi:type I restriction-modification system DNA methylase subunit